MILRSGGIYNQPNNRTPSPRSMATPVAYSAHPFDNNINPATAEGTKLWKTGTAELTNKIALNESNAKLIIAQLQKDSNQFRWGAQVNSIQNGPNATTVPRMPSSSH